MAQQTFFVIGGHCPRSKEDAQTIFNYFLKNGLKPKKNKKSHYYMRLHVAGLVRQKNHQ